MKRVVPVILMTVCLAFSASAQSEQRLSGCPAAFRTFYAGFVAAVKAGASARVAGMTKFPLTWGLDAGDEGTYTRPQFLRHYSRLFGRNSTQFTRERDPLCDGPRRGSITVTSSDALSLTFERFGRSYRLTAYIVEP